MTPRDVFLVLAIVFQMGVAVLLLSDRPVSRLRKALALVLTLNSLEAIGQFSGVPSLDILTNILYWVDGWIVLTLAYAMGLIPLEISKKWHVYYFIALAVWTLEFWIGVLIGGDVYRWTWKLGANLGWIPLIIIFAYFSMPKIRRFPAGPLRSHSLILVTALITAAAMTQIVEVWSFVVDFSNNRFDGMFSEVSLNRQILDFIVDKGLSVVVVWIFLVSFLQTVCAAVKRKVNREILWPFMLTAIVTTLVLLLDPTIYVQGAYFIQIREAPSQFLRPFILIIAITRYDSLSLPPMIRKWLMPIIFAVGFGVIFLTLSLIPHWDDPRFTLEGILMGIVLSLIILGSTLGIFMGRGEMRRRQNFVEFQLQVERDFEKGIHRTSELRAKFKLNKNEADLIVEQILKNREEN